MNDRKTSNKGDVGPQLIAMGCRLNAYESEAIKGLAAASGVEDAVIVNSCAVTNEAVRQTRQHIRRARRNRPSAQIIVTGCAAQIDPGAFAAMDEVDAVLGNAEKLDNSAWSALSRKGSSTDKVLVNDIMSVRDTANHLIDGYGDRARAFLQIQNGCDHRCTFCVIPYGRGNSRSVPIETIISQARRLTAAGHLELVLTGVDITSWGGDLEGAPKLGDLVAAILQRVPDLYQLRLSSIDGAEIDDHLVELIVNEPRIAPYLHLSLQSGDDMILKRMKRRHTRRQAIDFCRDLRKRRPEIAFGADIIAGFPTETDAMFQNSVDIVTEATLSYLHVFPFSPREGTPAARMPQLSRAVVKERASELRKTGDAATTGFLDSLIGGRDKAIVETGGRARLGNFAEVQLPALCEPRPGALVDVAIVGRKQKTLIGAIKAPVAANPLNAS